MNTNCCHVVVVKRISFVPKPRHTPAPPRYTYISGDVRSSHRTFCCENVRTPFAPSHRSRFDFQHIECTAQIYRAIKAGAPATRPLSTTNCVEHHWNRRTCPDVQSTLVGRASRDNLQIAHLIARNCVAIAGHTNGDHHIGMRNALQHAM